MTESELSALCTKIEHDCKSIRRVSMLIIAECILAFLVIYPMIICHVLG